MPETHSKNYIELKARCESQMELSVCSGCDACGLRCAAGIPATRAEWETLQQHLVNLSEEERRVVAQVEAQDKTVELGDGVSVQMCRYKDMGNAGCAVYAARPLVCRLLGHVEWMPCPIEKVPRPVRTADAVALMQAYAEFERHTFEEWEEISRAEFRDSRTQSGATH